MERFDGRAGEGLVRVFINLGEEVGLRLMTVRLYLCRVSVAPYTIVG